MSAALWEQYILAKTYFDPAGLIVATENARPIGFVHAGFGPVATGEQLDRSQGVICQLMAFSHADQGEILSELLSAAEDYLTRSGSRSSLAGNADRLGPFYLGLYGSSRLVGVLQSDQVRLAFLQAAGYQNVGQKSVLQRSLVGFRPPVDRDQVKHRKLHEMIIQHDPVARDWWEACATSHEERMSFELVPKCGGPVIAAATTTQLHALSCAWGVNAAGFEEVAAMTDAWLNGSALCLLAETMRTLQCQGVMLMEAVVDDLTSPLGKVLLALGFKEVDRGLVLRKELAQQ